MSNERIVKIIGYIELLIGLITAASLIVFSSLSISEKPLNVFIFVITSSIVSILLGLGLLDYQEWARQLIIFFSGYVIITKILILFELLYFSGEIITVVPAELKNCLSLLYHSWVILFFNQKQLNKIFKKSD